MGGWTAAQIASAIYSQSFLCCLSLKRVATALEELVRELRSESSHPSDGSWAAAIAAATQSDEEETFNSPNSAPDQTKGRQQQLFDDDSAVRPKGGRTDAGKRKPVNYEGRKPTKVVKCTEADVDAGFGNPSIREDLLEPDDGR